MRHYLEAQGDFAFELQVFHLVRSLGLRTNHGGTYEDPVTKKPRQYDVRAQFEDHHRRVAMAIECKALRTTSPLVVLRVQRSETESFHDLILAAEPAPDRSFGVTNFQQGFPLRLAPHQSLYPPGHWAGKSLVQVRRDGKGEVGAVSDDSSIYDKWSQALASADDLVAVGRSAHEDRGVPFFVTVVLAVLVISDGALWVADYDQGGTLMSDPIPATETTFFVGGDYGSTFSQSYTLSHLHICTIAGLQALLQRVANPLDGWWLSAFPAEPIRRRLQQVMTG